jgi:hypothetical protein
LMCCLCSSMITGSSSIMDTELAYQMVMFRETACVQK